MQIILASLSLCVFFFVRDAKQKQQRAALNAKIHVFRLRAAFERRCNTFAAPRRPEMALWDG